jgi:hypothetical protein
MNSLLLLQTNRSLLLLEKAIFRITADLDSMHPIAMNITTPPLILPLPLYP